MWREALSDFLLPLSDAVFGLLRTLCEFTSKRGDLDLRFTPSPTAQEDMMGHHCVTDRRGAGYETEISLRGEFGPLVVL